MKTAREKISRTAERASLLFAAVVVILIAVLSYDSGEAFRHSSDQAAATRELVDDTNALLSSLKDAETGQRGYLLTDEDRYLQPYRQALTEVPRRLERLTQVALQRKGSRQAQRVERLRSLVKGKMDELRETIDLRRIQGFDAALAVVRTNRGRELMDRIRGVCSEIQTATYVAARTQSEKARKEGSRAAWIAVLGSTAILLLLALAIVSIEKGTRRREQLIEAIQTSEDRIRESRDWLETTLASIGDGVITTDATGRITLLNAVAEKISGWSNAEAAGKPLDQVFVVRNEETGREVENPVSKVLHEGRIVGIANHTVLLAKDGRPVPIDDSAAPIRDRQAKAAGVIMVFRDISERRAAERRFAEQAAEVGRIKHLMEPVACFVRDLEDRIVYWNPGAADLYGFSQEEATGEISHSLLKTQFPTTYEETLAQLKSAGSWHGELLHTDRTGHQLTMASHWALHHDAEGRPSVILEVNLDITERKRAEEELRVTNQALSRANEDLKQFAFAASHDLQEPLRMITSYSQLLVKGYRGKLDEDASTCIEFITDGTRRMRALLNDLLAYTEVGNDGGASPARIDLNSVFEIAVNNCRAAIDESEASVTSDPLPVVAGQESHFIQLLQNLISNSLKYRTERRPVVHVSAERQAGFWRIAVEDNGIGIDPKYHKQIFGVFKRLHGKAISGTGMGLAICQRVVERYGGTIWVASQEGEGAIFYCTLPAAESPGGSQ
jgi:PAS domain S-box-containing protein